ncbi:DgyrCDS3793 [Dimorphilus gyrociliatus]|uniref:Intraflagellar transport protein 81 homolog n=1 Tax=Dimorphilus gyrociliatus TaxID=2664684 RepID=A0A7I8VGH3_9ANNE|nr:DgyrCDS3793 [Dimorphilus gyrociliatus]
MSTEKLKYIISQLSQPPFKKTYNMISFNNLEPLQLLQVVSDVLAEIDSQHNVDIREEAAEDTAIRIFNFLKIMKYRHPGGEEEQSRFRQGLVSGDKPIIYVILEWLLSRIDDLKKRAYLAKYLVKINIPPEFMQDDEVTDLFTQYSAYMEEFKEIHKQVEQLRSSGFNTDDIKRDIASMEDEKEQLMRRVDKLKKKVEGAPNSGPMLAVARKLHEEKDREAKLNQQKLEEKNLLIHCDQRISRLQNQLKDARQTSIGATPQSLLQRIEEENKTNTYLVKDKLPKEISILKKTVNDLQKVVSEPAMGQSDLENINRQIKETNAEINQLIEKRMVSGDPLDDKLSLFRQQAAIIARKKETAAESLREAREEIHSAQIEIEEKRNLLNANSGEEVLKGDEFKRYVNNLRTKSTTYKKKRAELAELRSELGVLGRTEEILKNRHHDIQRQLGKIEKKHGVSGFRETQEKLENISGAKQEVDEMKGKTLEDISVMVKKFNNKIAEKKNSLAPIIKELRPLRQKAQEMQAEHDQHKRVYDTQAAGFESNRSKLEQEVRALREECSAEESRLHYLNIMREITSSQQERINAEMKLYTSSNMQEKKRSLRDQFTRKIQDQENLGKSLREKQKSIKEGHSGNLNQMSMWRDFQRIMDMKLSLSGLGSGDGSGQQSGSKFSATEADALAADQLVL